MTRAGCLGHSIRSLLSLVDICQLVSSETRGIWRTVPQELLPGPMPEALIELTISLVENEEDVTNVGPGIVLPVVPAQGSYLECLVVPLLILLDEPLQADVTARFEAQKAGLEQEKQSRHPAIPVAKGMDAEEIEAEGPEGDEWMDPPRPKKCLVPGVGIEPTRPKTGDFKSKDVTELLSCPITPFA